MKQLKKFLRNTYQVRILTVEYNRHDGFIVEILRISRGQCQHRFDGALFGISIKRKNIRLGVFFFELFILVSSPKLTIKRP
jgi:hypothetical protein